MFPSYLCVSANRFQRRLFVGVSPQRSFPFGSAPVPRNDPPASTKIGAWLGAVCSKNRGCMEPPSHDYCLSCTEARERIIQGACKVEWQMANELRLLPSSEHVLFGSTLAYALLTASPLLSKEEPPPGCLFAPSVTNLRDRRFSPRVRDHLT